MFNFMKKFKSMFARKRIPPKSSSVIDGSFYGIDDKTVEDMLLASDTPSCVYCIDMIPDERVSSGLDWLQAVNAPNLTSQTKVSKETAFGIGSFQKPIIALACCRIIGDEKYLKNQTTHIQEIMRRAWDKRAFSVLNKLLKSRGLDEIPTPIHREPSVKQLLQHIHAFPPNQKFLFGPDGTCLLSKEEILGNLTFLVDRTNELEPGKSCYSNFNYIVVGLIIELALGMELSQALRYVVLEELGMNDTILDFDSFEERQDTIANAFITTVDSKRLPIAKRPYLSDAVELAAGGGYSTASDIAKLLHVLLKGSLNREDQIWKKFFETSKGIEDETGTYWSTMGGFYAPLDSAVTGLQSFDRTHQAQPYQLGKRNGKSVEAICKAGTVQGFSSHYYLIPTMRMFILVLTNSSGIVDASNHISQYILQQALGLDEEIDFVREVVDIRRKRIQVLRKDVWGRQRQENFSLSELKALAGEFTYGESLQRITIQVEQDGQAYAIIHGCSRRPTSRLHIEKINGETFMLRSQKDKVSIDELDAWRPEGFKIVKEGTQVVALQSVVATASQLSLARDLYRRTR